MEYIPLVVVVSYTASTVGKPYGSWPLVCTVPSDFPIGCWYLLKQFGGRFQVLCLVTYKLYQQWAWMRFVQPGLCGWEGSSVILKSGKRHLDKVNSLNTVLASDRLRIALAPRSVLQMLECSGSHALDEVKHRLGKRRIKGKFMAKKRNSEIRSGTGRR